MSKKKRSGQLLRVLLVCILGSIPYFFISITFASSQKGGAVNQAAPILSLESVQVSSNERRQQQSLPTGMRPDGKRIAFLLTFLGQGPEDVPSFINVFCFGAAGAADVSDFFIFHNGVLDSLHFDCPENVKFISLGTTEAFARRFLRVVNDNNRSDELVRVLAKRMQDNPHSLVEFKPALGYIFSDYIRDYSHWGYSDLDILFGELSRWISKDELNDFDIVTYSDGDQERLYLRGQFTFHKNKNKVNLIWKSCDHLHNLENRLIGGGEFSEGASEVSYANAVLEQKDLSVKYAVKAWSISGGEGAGVYVGRDFKRDRVVVFEADGEWAKELLDWTPMWLFNARDRQVAKGKLVEIKLPDGKNNIQGCIPGADPKFQARICLDTSVVHASHTLFWINGRLFKQSYKNVPVHPGVRTAPFHHFRVTKRGLNSGQLAPLHYSSQENLFALHKVGVIPLPEVPKTTSNSPVETASPLGVPARRWKTATRYERALLPSRFYCLVSGPQRIEKSSLPFSKCSQRASWRDHKTVEILSGAARWIDVDVDTDVTLAMTLQVSGAQAADQGSLLGMLDIVAKNLSRWHGKPCVVVLHVAGATDETMDFLRRHYGPESDLSNRLENSLIALVSHAKDDAVSRKALMNMAIDAVPTRWFVSGLELERGLILSDNAMELTHRASLHGGKIGLVFLIPQFALEDYKDNSWQVTLSDLVTAGRQQKVKHPSKLEQACEKSEKGLVERLSPVNLLWWSQVQSVLSVAGRTGVRAWHLGMEQSFPVYEYELKTFALDESPIMLTDNIGPRVGVSTHTISREVEEFGGRRCFNGFRLGRLAALGYRFKVLGGAFAFSTNELRKVAARGHHESQCNGCFMLGDDQERVLDMVENDADLVEKTTALWHRIPESKYLV